MKDKVILIGAIDKGGIPTNGVTMKNQLFLKRFSELFPEVRYVDTWLIGNHPWTLIKIVWYLLFHKKHKFIFSGSYNIHYFFDLIFYLHLKRDVYYWVAGGKICDEIENGKFNIQSLQNLRSIIVQGESMKKRLIELGFSNAVYVPNSKPITYSRSRNFRVNDIFHFVFLSRVHPDKGCDDIFECVKRLNEDGLIDKYDVSFYGPVYETYEKSFNEQVEGLDNVYYKGFLNLTVNQGYEDLSQYDAMLFPTYWKGEGFPGVVIDAYIAGVPIIASDWNLNKYVINDGVTGYLIPVHKSDALYQNMKKFILNQVDIIQLKSNCLIKSKEYDFRHVLSDELFRKLGFE